LRLPEPAPRATPPDRRAHLRHRHQLTGKSTIGEHLTTLIEGAYIKLDALFWLLEWQMSEIEDSPAKLRVAIDESSRWAISGNYFSHYTPGIVLSQAGTWIWIDLRFRSSFPRLLHRTGRRWRDNELPQGTNRENA